MNYRDEIQNIMNKLPHKLQVRYAYLCCMDIKDLMKDEASLNALGLVELWLIDESKVSKEELRNAASYAAYAANNAAYAINYDMKIKECCELAKAMTKDLTALERFIFNLEDL